VLSSDEVLSHIAASLNSLRKRARLNGSYWSVELESLRLLANERQAAPSVAADADSGEPLCITYKEAARRLSVSERTVNRLIAKGGLPRVVIGDDCHRITVADLQAYTEGLRRERMA
jgi:excisionase family DNA binding protein